MSRAPKLSDAAKVMLPGMLNTMDICRLNSDAAIESLRAALKPKYLALLDQCVDEIKAHPCVTERDKVYGAKSAAA